LLTSGRYIFEETEIEIPGSGYTVRSVYVSEGNIRGSIGEGWATSLDSRIIRGITPVDRAALEAVREDVEKLKANAEIEWEYAAARAIGREIEAMYQEALGRYMEVKAVADRADLLRGKNGVTFFFGTPEYYQGIGNENLTVIDERGVPYIFLYEGNGVWKAEAKEYNRYMSLTSVDGKDAAEASGFIVTGRGGVRRYAGADGFWRAVELVYATRVSGERVGGGMVVLLSGPHVNRLEVKYGGEG
jgi:hypothetical protein